MFFRQVSSVNYQQQLDEKIQRIHTQFAEFRLPEIAVFASPEQHFRMRAEFRIWHTDDDLFYAMFERNEAQSDDISTAEDEHKKKKTKKVIKIEDFPIADQSINQLMPKLLDAIKTDEILSKRLFEIDFLSSLSGEMLVSMIYHRKLDDLWQQAAQQLEQRFNIKIIGRSRGQKIVLSEDFVVEKMRVKDQNFEYKQIENGFTQPNAIVCQKMLTWACDAAQHTSGDLLELYCGNGNFTLPLAQYFPKVLATELAKSSVYAAEWNIAKNQIQNIQIARLSAEEFTEAYQGKREFRRLTEQNIHLSDYDFGTVFVDPPRAGIDDGTLQLISQFDAILYISCNPDTLHDNLKTLTQTHDIIQFALFDQFPYTHHVESGVLLQKKTVV